MRYMLFGVLVGLGFGGQAEAGVGEAVKNVFLYAVSPANCLGNFGLALVRPHDGTAGEIPTFLGCVAGNVNRNPLTLNGPVVQ